MTATKCLYIFIHILNRICIEVRFLNRFQLKAIQDSLLCFFQFLVKFVERSPHRFRLIQFFSSFYLLCIFKNVVC